ncbi:hypothetical protein [Tellurirhabdus rosea]|uniref:hypothetical protein n=1 Tax=Tellurirhabdus rosea TaxID=2674997 RepID=UPI002B1CBFFE|nr:hypothetical protein [Tellurirhabdus rosea]
MSMTFEQYLISKKIDAEAFNRQEADRFNAWKALFEQMHPESFTTEKKFLINEVRRRYRISDVAPPHSV